MGLSPEMFIQLEQIKRFAAACEKAGNVCVIGSSSNPVNVNASRRPSLDWDGRSGVRSYNVQMHDEDDLNLTINQHRIDLDEAYMQMAEIWAKRSKANRLQVGALIVKDKQIISDGYNGMPAGDVHEVCEYWELQDDDLMMPILRTKPEVLHAESNALMKITENGGVGAQGATLYTTYSPCFECAKLIKQAKISRVVFRHQYRDPGGIDMLRKRGVTVDQLA
jgi:dCMP deaminase